MTSLLPSILPLTRMYGGLNRSLRSKIHANGSVYAQTHAEINSTEPTLDDRSKTSCGASQLKDKPEACLTETLLPTPSPVKTDALAVAAVVPSKLKGILYAPFDPPCRRTRSRLAAASKVAVAPLTVPYDPPSRHTRASGGRQHPFPNGAVQRGSSKKISRASLEHVKAAILPASLPPPFADRGADHEATSSSYCCSSVLNTAEPSAAAGPVSTSSNFTVPPFADVPLRPPPKPSPKRGRRRKRSDAVDCRQCCDSTEPPFKKTNIVLHRRVVEPPRPMPHPGVPLELSHPPFHPLPADVAVLCRSKQTEEYRWCQILDHYQSCGERWMYYVHYAGTDRRLDEWIDTDRVVLSSVRLSLPPEFCDAHIATRDAADQKFSEILQRSEKHMVHSLHDFERSVITRTKTVDSICFGAYEINAWYFSPYPVQSSRVLHICEYCLKYVISAELLAIHYQKCRHRHPPGDEIYRDPAHGLSVFEVSGRNERLYCQNLCLLAKLFLDHKTMYYDVQHFMFYVLCQFNDDAHCGFKLVGYFSKERVDDWNLACILILPPFQRRGYGRFLIEFSYALSKKEGKPGTPERPLSDLGRVSYFSYWKNTLLREIIGREGECFSIKFLSSVTAIKSDDIVHTLQALNCLHTLQNGVVIIKLPSKLREEVLSGAANASRLVSVDMARLHYYPPSLHGR